MAKLPKKITDKIAEYKKTQDEKEKRLRGLKDALALEESKLAQLKEELKEKLVSEEIQVSDAEIDLRKEIAATELKINSYQDKARATQGYNGIDEARGIVKETRAYVEEKYRQELPTKLKAIEDAKMAYLEALVDYGEHRRSFLEMYNEATFATNYTVREYVGVPSLPEVAWRYRGDLNSDGNKYTIFMDEMNSAIDDGEIKRKSRL
ncbi:hypothetical protein [Shouchella clausii]|uniref:hypothetical protein n=1 Tax=Shouchella clausii TaxID=79880 RepID=UPI000BA5DF6A|nr:hypothetical protein [Shouchella clausii]PAD19121.1 hypothetical protein CHH73_03400 [Shouchella clausii]